MARSPAELLAASAWKLHQSGQLDQAIEIYRRAAAMAPNYAEIHNNLGNALRAAGRPAEAVTSLKRAARLKPEIATVHTNLGLALADIGHFQEAAASHRQALKLQPDLALAHNNFGTALLALGKFEEAGTSYRRALELQPDFAEAYGNLGDALRRLERFEEAAASFRRARELKPGFGQAMAQHVFMERTICDWRDMAPVREAFLEAARSDERGALAFAFLAIADDPVLQLQMARHDSRTLGDAAGSALWQGQRYEHAKIRLAYLSADFYEHATAYLMAELFERHDRSRFDLYAISYGRNDSSSMYRRLTKAFDHFVDASGLSDYEAATRIRNAEIDIAVDLKGHTREARPRILGYRPAPIQVNYLGYPGSMGADFIDYAIVDPFVVPLDQQVNFMERLVYLPDCYQVNDSKREIAQSTPSRQECGLPEGAFVFCCFNNNYKLTPALFDIWMRLLKAVPGSVIWLLGDNEWAVANLRGEARARGVEPERLIFAPRMSLADHLARHRLADLFLDTLPYNAHTTASDALWAGLPVLSCAGQGFAARVAGSLLGAVGLPELVVGSLGEYEDMALGLATQPGRLQALRKKLAQNRLRTPLFNTDRFRRHIEAAYIRMWQIWQQGERPATFAVEPAGETL
jgi:protein O-GlcNAc transferase